MDSAERERALARLARLATAAREKLDRLGRDVESLRLVIDRTFIDVTETVVEGSDAALRGTDKKAGNGTPDPGVAQVEVVSK